MNSEMRLNDVAVKEEPYLPTLMELEAMERSVFEEWIHQASHELQKRQERRDPLFLLKKRIAEIISNPVLTEVQKEACVLHEIECYMWALSQSR
ncbi:hypothetical protein [Gorillibacterium sp. sgz5001074]|uniref:hypothetical protein n=1 Tax=Gorillibacterium sp. sgz5001074 TaxID=3446695 RepID=UPI003F664FC1